MKPESSVKHTVLFAILLTLVLSLLSGLPGCRSGREKEIESEILAARAENQAKAENVREEESLELAERNEPDGDGSEGSGDGGVKSASKTDWDGILSSGYQIAGNKYYFRTMERKRVNGVIKSVSITSYIDLTTGESGVICPDPLCGHDDSAVCRYIDVNAITDFTMADEHTYIRGYRSNPNAKTKICAFDLTQNDYRVLYTPKQFSPDQLGVEDGVLWLREYYSKTSKKTTTYYQTIIGVRISDGEIVYQNAPPEDAKAFFFHGGLLYCDNVKSIIAFEPDTGNTVTLLEYAAEDQLGSWYYDTFRNEFWFSILNQAKQTGRVYRYADGKCEEVSFPCGEVYFFQLTNTTIYYSPYDPVYLGESPAVSYGTWDYTGGKIFAVLRDDPAGEAKPVYDAEGKYSICNVGVRTYLIFGNKLYFDHVSIVRQKRKDPETGQIRDYVFFDSSESLSKIQIDLVTGAEKEIRFD